MEPNKLEQEFRDKLEQRKIQPSEMAWDRLDAMLSVAENKKPKTNRTWLYMAAAFLVFLLVGVLFLNQEKANNGTLINTQDSVVDKQGDIEQSGKPEIIVPDNTANDEVIVEVKENAPSFSKHTPIAVKNNTDKKIIINTAPIVKQEAIALIDKKESPNEIATSSTDNLLATVSTTPKKKSGVKVDPNSLLSSVEGELNDSYRSKAFQSVVKGFNTVKVAVANRNYE
ncbi:hypothetical protein [Flavobacterium sp. NRK1]|uniref:hypothetical protein n=1 Tax=Flavobacterium sp. NRK1 TaxID=2954929 RepID=UPI002092C6C1|nr:hypothetical protein [Flavobacterium sp. NRK1]MCO6147089.1 hypothetical protein [Flavobacterium sp. NRK1]